MQNSVLTVADLRVRYAGSPRDAVAGISFTVAAGEVFGLLGPNGAGKSTTQRVLTGQHHSFAGTVTVLGKPVGSWGRRLYERIGVGFELPAYFPKLTVRENLAAFAALYRHASPVRPGDAAGRRAVLGRRSSPVDDAVAAVGSADAADRGAVLDRRAALGRRSSPVDDAVAAVGSADAADRGAVLDRRAAPGRQASLVDEALDAVGLGDAADRRAAALSKGMKMRLNLARALLHRPEVLFLDEPTSGLDPANAAAVRSVIRAQADAGRTVFLTTHDMPAVEELCTRVAFMRAGGIVAIDTPRNLRLAYGRPTVVAESLVDGALRRTEFPATDDPGLLALLATGRVQTVHTREAALSDVFIAVTKAAA